jgi:hypothetical protein
MLRGPQWGRSQAVNGRRTSDNYGQSRPLNDQLSGPIRPRTAGQSYRPFRSRTEEVAG